MKIIRNILISAMLTVFTAMASYAAGYQYALPVGLNAAGATETIVVVSTGPAAVTVLAANASRLDFDIELTSCNVTTSKVWYGYDGAFTVALSTNTPANWINFSLADPSQRKFKKPDWIMPTGNIVAVTDGAASSCWLTVREWVSTSPVFQ